MLRRTDLPAICPCFLDCGAVSSLPMGSASHMRHATTNGHFLPVVRGSVNQTVSKYMHAGIYIVMGAYRLSSCFRVVVDLCMLACHTSGQATNSIHLRKCPIRQRRGFDPRQGPCPCGVVGASCFLLNVAWPPYFLLFLATASRETCAPTLWFRFHSESRVGLRLLGSLFQGERTDWEDKIIS